jgi:glycosyltransferase involved in cell wall biosynthesis
VQGLRRKMKILMIDNIFLSESGGDTHLLKVLEHWSKISTIKIRLIMPGQSKFLRTKNNINLIIEIIIVYILRIIKTLFMRMKEQFDVIVTSSHYPPDVLSAIFLKLRNPKAKLIVYAHGMFPEVSPQYGIMKRTLSLVYNYLGILLAMKFADLLFIFNNHTKCYLKSMGVNERLVLTSNGVEIPILNIFPQDKLFEASFLGRIVPSKGIFDLVKIWKKVCEHKKTSKLLIIGSGLTELLKEAARREGISENIILAGYVPEEIKLKLLRNSRLFVFPSYIEGWGIAIAEAMACGLPVVAYNLPVYKEVFDDKLITVPLGDVEEMARKVIYLLENPEIARKMGEANREFVKKYDWKTIAEKELFAIINLINKR